MSRYRWCKLHNEWERYGEHCRPRTVDAANVINDVEPHYSPATGTIVTSRSEIREGMRKHDLIELGNERPNFTPYGER